MAQPTTQRSGVVGAVNPKGLKLEGEAGWLNYTTQRELPRAAVGDVVILTLGNDDAGAPRWINAIQIGAAAQAQPSNGNGNGASHPPARDMLNARMSALKSAVRLGCGRPEVGSRETLQVADFFLAWLLRAGGSNHDPIHDQLPA
jgi:hypothetical protein